MSLEVFYFALKHEITSKFHAVIAAIHFSLIQLGFKCVELGETIPVNPLHGPFSDMLPKNWHQSNKKCSLVYFSPYRNKFLVFKMFNMHSYALAHALRDGGNSITDLDIVYDTYLGDELTRYDGLYKEPQGLVSLIVEKLIKPSVPKSFEDKIKIAKMKSSADPSSVSSEVYFDPFEKSLSMDTYLGIEPCPFCREHRTSDISPIILPSGRSDLDPPLGRGCTCGRGGMLFDPLRNLGHPGRPQPNDPNIPPGGMIFDPLRNLSHPGRPQPNDPNIPPGSVPPGARFDPIGPVTTPPNVPRPDPDEMRPPGSREHYF